MTCAKMTEKEKYLQVIDFIEDLTEK